MADFKWLAILMLFVIGLILSAGKTVYDLMEKLTKTIIMAAVPFILLLAVWLSSKTDWLALAHGVIGRGDGFLFLPNGIVLATFLAAFAYSGAGGNLNLTQSIYIKEKGYGMGRYSQKIGGLFRKKEEDKIRLAGEKFEINEKNISHFKSWWKIINLEHLLVFWFIGGVAMLLLMLLSFSTTFGLAGNAEGIHFVISEGRIIGQNLSHIIGILFLLAVSIMLFQTQLGVMDSTSRIMSENAAILRMKEDPEGKINLSKIYFIFVWAQIAFGIVLFLLNIDEPKTLIILGAVINAFAMFIHTGLVAWLNHKSLPKVFRPSLFRKIVIAGIFAFFGFFSAVVLLDKLGLV